MLLLSRYLLKYTFLTTLALSVVLTLIIWLAQSLRLLDFIINGGAPFKLFALMLFLTIPKFFEVILPISLALGIIYSLNKLSADSEIVVMHNSGASPWRLASGVILFSVGLAVFMFFISGWITPMANSELDRLRGVVKSDYGLGLLRPGIFNVIGDDTTIYIAKRSDLQDLHGVFIQIDKKGELPTTITAQRGGLVSSNGKTYVVVIDGVRQQFNPRTKSLEKLKFKNYNLDLSPLLSKAPRDRLNPNEEKLSDLFVHDPNDKPAMQERKRAELHTRLSRPLLVLCFGFLSLAPFMNSYHNRRGNNWRIFSISLLLLGLQAINLGTGQLASRSAFGLFLLYGTPILTILASICYLSNFQFFARFSGINKKQ